ncbi:MAG: hypothetical protein JKY54_18595 [Flavobacteriales bacterium]|nr:hypothetical protein [Flavobacteriales bacterium]
MLRPIDTNNYLILLNNTRNHYTGELIIAVSKLLPIVTPNNQLNTLFDSIRTWSEKNQEPYRFAPSRENPFKDQLKDHQLPALCCQRSPSMNLAPVDMLKSLSICAALCTENHTELDRSIKRIRIEISKFNTKLVDSKINSLLSSPRLDIELIHSILSQSDLNPLEKCIQTILKSLIDRNFDLSEATRSFMLVEQEDCGDLVAPNKRKSNSWLNYFLNEDINSAKLFTPQETNAAAIGLKKLGENHLKEALVFELSYAFGLSLEESLSLKWNVDLDRYHYYCHNSVPTDAKKQLAGEIFINSKSSVNIQLPENIKDKIQLLLGDNGTYLSIGKILELEPEETKIKFKNFLKKLRIKHPRITYYRFIVQSQLLTWLQTQNIALLFLMHDSGRWKAPSQTYYCQFGANTVEQQFYDNYHKLQLTEDLIESKKDKIGRIECHVIIKHEWLSDTISSARKKVIDSLKKAISDLDKKTAFNLYTVYIYFLLLVTTGVRNTSLFLQTRITPITSANLIFGTDKPTYHHAKDRLIVVPEEVKIQLEDYLELKQQIFKNNHKIKNSPLFMYFGRFGIRILETDSLKLLFKHETAVNQRLRATLRSWLINTDYQNNFCDFQFGHGYQSRHFLGNSSTVTLAQWIKSTVLVLNQYSNELSIKSFSTKKLTRYEDLAAQQELPQVKQMPVTLKDAKLYKSLKYELNNRYKALPYKIEKELYDDLQEWIERNFGHHIRNQRCLNRLFRYLKRQGHLINFAVGGKCQKNCRLGKITLPKF